MTSDGHDPDTRSITEQAASDEPAPQPLRAGIEGHARRRLGLSLRLYYASVLNQELPDRFRQLIAELPGPSTDSEGTS